MVHHFSAHFWGVWTPKTGPRQTTKMPQGQILPLKFVPKYLGIGGEFDQTICSTIKTIKNGTKKVGGVFFRENAPVSRYEAVKVGRTKAKPGTVKNVKNGPKTEKIEKF